MSLRAFASCILSLLHGWLSDLPECESDVQSRGEIGGHAGGTMGDGQGCTCKPENSGPWGLLWVHDSGKSTADCMTEQTTDCLIDSNLSAGIGAVLRAGWMSNALAGMETPPPSIPERAEVM